MNVATDTVLFMFHSITFTINNSKNLFMTEIRNKTSTLWKNSQFIFKSKRNYSWKRIVIERIKTPQRNPANGKKHKTARSSRKQFSEEIFFTSYPVSISLVILPGNLQSTNNGSALLATTNRNALTLALIQVRPM